MPNQPDQDQLVQQLNQLEAELSEAGLWSQTPPDPEAMNSIQPFAYDTLTLPQWLQWIFIARMRALLDANAALPENCNIHSYAEEWFRREDIQADAILKIIAELDELLGGPPPQTSPMPEPGAEPPVQQDQ